MRSKWRDFGISILYFLNAVGGQVLVGAIIGIVGGIIIAVKHAINNPTEEVPMDLILEFVTKATTWMIIISAGFSLLIYLLVFKIAKKSFIAGTGLVKGKGLYLIFSIILGITLNFIISGIINITDIQRFFPEHQKISELLVGETSLIVTFLAVVITAPFFEEIVFRGLILGQMKKSFPIIVAVIIQSLLFGLYHFNVLQGMYAFILGIAAGVVCLWGDSLWNAILLHLSFNGTSLIIGQLFKDKDMTTIYYLITISLSLCAAIFVFILFYQRKEQRACS
ncbi:MAG: CPBP family intramembrane metalloprotease [Epulopiscium sp.]|nr:CPBP family intramembrane metalloprotease [Candidatus Epulonipiscium sp.]